MVMTLERPTTATLKRDAKLAAKLNGHRLDKWEPENGNPTAVCYCGAYVTVEGEHWSTGSLLHPRTLISDPCPGPPRVIEFLED